MTNACVQSLSAGQWNRPSAAMRTLHRRPERWHTGIYLPEHMSDCAVRDADHTTPPCQNYFVSVPLWLIAHDNLTTPRHPAHLPTVQLLPAFAPCIASKSYLGNHSYSRWCATCEKELDLSDFELPMSLRSANREEDHCRRDTVKRREEEGDRIVND